MCSNCFRGCHKDLSFMKPVIHCLERLPIKCVHRVADAKLRRFFGSIRAQWRYEELAKTSWPRGSNACWRRAAMWPRRALLQLWSAPQRSPTPLPRQVQPGGLLRPGPKTSADLPQTEPQHLGGTFFGRGCTTAASAKQLPASKAATLWARSHILTEKRRSGTCR